jgi:UDPglucose 6-dehydrogenase
LVTIPNTAELIKYASNTFLDNKIVLINELSDLCEKVKADIENVSLGVGLYKSIGKYFLKVGPGFGGSCLSKGIKSLWTRGKIQYMGGRNDCQQKSGVRIW